MHKTADSASPPARMSTGCGTTRPGWGGVKKPEMAASVSGSSALPASSMKTCVKWPGGTPMAHSCRGGGAAGLRAEDGEAGGFATFVALDQGTWALDGPLTTE